MTGFAEFAASIGLSEFQLSLGLIGFSLLIILMIYNALRIRKAEVEEVTFTENGEVVASFESANSSELRAEPTLGLPSAIKGNVYFAHEKIDSLIDCVIAMRFSEPISGEEILNGLSSWPQNTQHLWMCEGLVSQAAGTDPLWENLQVSKSYLELQVAVQLANRTGPIGVVDLSDFSSRAQVLANALDAEIDLPPINDILEEAKAIDSFSAQSDIQLGITVQPKSGLWNLNEIKNSVLKAGFQLSRDGREYHRIMSGLTTYKLIADQSNFLRDDLDKQNISAITLLLDLPKVPQEMSPFKTMLNDARLLAESLNGHLVDDAGRPLVNEAVTAIQAQLDQIYQSMYQHGIAAGSSTANRLFS
ncbi:MAG: hypothetical protein RLZZ410_268 [Pseudomonadota bacterium]|jgi:hypothetical protein